MVERLRAVNFNKIAAIEALGFPFGGALASRLWKELVLLRKEGTVKDESDYHWKEFSDDHSGKQKTFRVRKKAIATGDRVVIVDEHSESGAQIKAAARLLKEKAGAEIVCVLLVSADTAARYIWGHHNCPCRVEIVEPPGGSPPSPPPEWEKRTKEYW